MLDNKDYIVLIQNKLSFLQIFIHFLISGNNFVKSPEPTKTKISMAT